MTSIQTNTVDPNLLTTMNGSKGGKSTVDGAQDRFMTLLVTQMRNQDPLNPMDNAQVTSQLAQLSTVSGIDKLNVSVNALNANFRSGQTLQAANMIGHGVVVSGNVTALDKGKAFYGMDLPQGADKVEVTIRDAAGVAVRKIDLGAMPAGISSLSWDGMTDKQTAAPGGNYTFDVSASVADKTLDVTSLSFGVVSSVASGSQGVKLNIANLGDFDLADVRKIY